MEYGNRVKVRQDTATYNDVKVFALISAGTIGMVEEVTDSFVYVDFGDTDGLYSGWVFTNEQLEIVTDAQRNLEKH